jgi:hypothetical protein
MQIALAAGCVTTPPLGDDDDAATPPEEEACEDGVCILSGTITESRTLSADLAWVLRGGVFIGDDASETVLTIEPGTTIYGEASTDGMLVIRRGSKLIADGTEDAPIVFTSSKPAGSRARGDWGGLVVNGRATINTGNGAACDSEEGQGYGEGGTGWYGGCDDEDDSGVLRYVRVEFAGTLISPDNELNGIAFQGVGRGTDVDFVQVHMNADDGIEFFGGTVDAKHLLVTGAADDSFDWTDGWRGRGQFLVAQQFADAADNGIEADNNAEANDAEPRSNPTLSHVTVVGAPDGGETASDLGMLLREGTAGVLANVVAVGFNDGCLDVNHDATFTQLDSGDLRVERSLLGCAEAIVEDGDDPTDLSEWFDSITGNDTADPQLVSAFDAAAPDLRPSPGSPAATGGESPADPFFTAASYRGGIDPTDDWTAGWTIHDLN